ncbi:hypothetical protein ACOYR1_17090 [Thalassotalea piscium]
MILSLTTIAVLLTTPALTMLAVSFLVSIFEKKDGYETQDCMGNLTA